MGAAQDFLTPLILRSLKHSITAEVNPKRLLNTIQAMTFYMNYDFFSLDHGLVQLPLSQEDAS